MIYDPSDFSEICLVEGRRVDRTEESQMFRSLDQTVFFLGPLVKSNFLGEILINELLKLKYTH